MIQVMGEIKFDQDAVASICRQLNTVKSGIGRESNRVNSVHTVLWADQALTNAFSASLITEIKTAARKLDKQKELLVQYHAQVQSIAEAFPDADHHRGPINRILTSLLSTYFVSNTGLFGIAVLGLMGEKTDSSSSSVSGTDETGECVSLYDWIFGKSKNNKTITVEEKKDYDVSGTYEKKLAAEEKAYYEQCEDKYVSLSEMSQMGWVNTDESSVKELYRALDKYGITDKREIEFFLAVCMHETFDGRSVVEDVTNPVYTDKYKGAGYIQLTWEGNYRDFAEAVGDPQILEQGCAYVAKKYAWESAAWYWKTHVHSEFVHDIKAGCTDIQTLRYISNLVNSGSRNGTCIGWDDRYARFIKVKQVMG